MKYQNLDLEFQLENIIDWVKREPSKAKKSAKGNLNLFFQRWLNREKPQYRKITHERIRPNTVEAPAKELTPEEERAEKIKDLQGSIKNAEVFLSKPEAMKDKNAMGLVRGNLERFQRELAELQGKVQP